MTERRGTLAERVAHVERWIDGENGDEGAAERIRRIRTDVDGLMSWRKWVLGAVSAAGIIIGVVLEQVRDHWPWKMG